MRCCLWCWGWCSNWCLWLISQEIVNTNRCKLLVIINYRLFNLGDWCWVAPGSEARLKTALARALGRGGEL